MAASRSVSLGALVCSSLLCLSSLGAVHGDPSTSSDNNLSKDQGLVAIVPRSFCLLTDRDLHINMLLSGYHASGGQDVRSSETEVVRSWIRELAIFWTKGGKSHSLVLAARRGPNQEREEGYLQSLTVDGTALPRLSLGDEASLFDGDASVSFEAYEKSGPFDVDVYRIQIDGLFEGEVRLRIASPLLQEEGDAEVHMNLDILDLQYTPAVNGVIGQSYQDSSSEQSLDYSRLGLMASPAQLEHVQGYVASSLMATDCAVSQYAHKQVDSAEDSAVATA